MVEAVALRGNAEAALRREHAVLERFVALLERESQLLNSATPEQVEALTTAKQQLLTEAYRLNDERPPLTPLLAGSPLWKSIEALARRAQELNTINMRMLVLHRTACEGRLGILTARRTPSTYRMDGTYA